MYDYTAPAWPTDGNDNAQTSCTISNLEDGVKYYFVVRAYAGSNQSGDSNEILFKYGSSVNNTAGLSNSGGGGGGSGGGCFIRSLLAP